MALRERERVGKEGAIKGRGNAGSDGACDGIGIEGRRFESGERFRSLPKWMEKLPGNRRRGLRKGSRDGQSRGNGSSGSGGGRIGRATRFGSRFR